MKKSLFLAFAVLVAVSVFVGVQYQTVAEPAIETSAFAEAAVLGVSNLEMVEKISAEWKTSDKAFAQVSTPITNSPGQREGCTHCHNGMVFASGVHTNGVVGDHMTGLNCQACHTGTGEELMKAGKLNVSMRHFTGTYIKSDFTEGKAGKGALCITCHSGRRDPATNLKGYIAGTNGMAYSHYGQGPIIFGQGAMPIEGVTFKTSSAHASIQDSCVACHMSDTKDGYASHSFKMNKDNVATACGTCHTGAKDFDINGVQTDMYKKLNIVYDEIKKFSGAAEVRTSGSTGFTFHKADGTAIAYKPTPAQYTLMYNWYLVKGDKSKGVHNPQYLKSVLSESYKAVTGKGLW
ncbi:hypothetical protein BHU72_04210 [Desulfuribacillus stibiiarsenatis]|uniref:Cytochrome c-552/4 domain-containing protein n=1 Tax=Desulfuribacillus stibiiarsenatis TaxID=1390249 RepID=A0A1E5L593_9FIRM|nr:ammonia-forming cytochrome c nitrite reductase subunit c552 [Desulfuribacillus stibiiarsenatis]OEH85305.1 hypothetical protein BHU72_04210 [Desulfuribacillus stibiiarsenatis]